MHLTKEEQILLQHFNDMIQLSYQRSIPVYSQFCSLSELELAYQALEEFYGKFWKEGEQFITFGGYPDAERKIICFLPQQEFSSGYQAIPRSEDFPICCVQAEPVNKHFCDSLNHRDFLGAVMHLGITRNQIGDIVVRQENRVSTGYIFCKKDKAELLLRIDQIKHTTVAAQLADFNRFSKKTEFMEITGSVSSFRLDAIIALAIHSSRSKALALIQAGNVFLNGRCCTENAKKGKEGDVFSIRGYGKFLFEKASTLSKKGRYHIIIKKYI